jgi:hypothetical protein
MLREPARGEGHTNAVAATLSQGTSRGFDACCDAIFGMPGASSVELSEAFDVIKRHSRPVENLVVSVDGFYFGEMEHRV